MFATERDARPVLELAYRKGMLGNGMPWSTHVPYNARG